MGLTTSSIHIYGTEAPAKSGAVFASYSAGWLTLLREPDAACDHDANLSLARALSKKTDAPVLCFGIFDSESISFSFFHHGKLAARYEDAASANKNLYAVPALVGYASGEKRRLSALLSCDDSEMKTALLEEFFGVCLVPDVMETPEDMVREKGTALFLAYTEENKALKGKKAPYKLELVTKYAGKSVSDHRAEFCSTHKPHHFLWGYRAEADQAPIPVCFTGEALTVTDRTAYEEDRLKGYNKMEGTAAACRYENGRYFADFSEDAPPAFRGRTMPLPRGMFLGTFVGDVFLFRGKNKVYVADESLKIVAKLSVKGFLSDVMGEYLLTETGDSSFLGFEPRAAIYIYRLVKQ